MASSLSRRSFLALSAMLPWALKSGAASASVPIGIEMYSVREAMKKDLEGTVRAIAEMGYQGLEFYAPYFEWSDVQTKNMRKLLDSLGIKCFSTHNDEKYFSADNLDRARDMNLALGSKYMIMSSSAPKTKLDEWKQLGDKLNGISDNLAPSGLKTGYHNHQPEFTPLEGTRPIEVLAKNTKSSVALQFDVGTAIEAGSDPVAWVKANPGRFRSFHLKDWAPDPKGYSVLFGEGVGDWKNIFAAAESVGGVEYYLLEQEGSRFSEMETAKRCLQAYRTIHS